MNIVQMVVPTVQIRFASVARILHLKMNRIWKHVERKIVLIWDRALLNAIMIRDARVHEWKLSKHSMENVLVR